MFLLLFLSPLFSSLLLSFSISHSLDRFAFGWHWMCEVHRLANGHHHVYWLEDKTEIVVFFLVFKSFCFQTEFKFIQNDIVFPFDSCTHMHIETEKERKREWASERQRKESIKRMHAHFVPKYKYMANKRTKFKSV